MLEYSILAGSEWMPLFTFGFIKGLVSIIISAVILLFLGYLIKGIGGAIIAFSTGTLFYLYFKGILIL